MAKPDLDVFNWNCPKCNELMEIVPFTEVKTKRKGVAVACCCKYEKHYFEEGIGNNLSSKETLTKELLEKILERISDLDAKDELRNALSGYFELKRKLAKIQEAYARQDWYRIGEILKSAK